MTMTPLPAASSAALETGRRYVRRGRSGQV